MRVIGVVDADWSPQFAFKQVVKNQIEKEDKMGWSGREEPESKVVPPLPSTKLSPAAQVGLGSQISKFVHKFKP